MANWRYFYVYGGTSRDFSINYNNVTGTPCVSVTGDDSGIEAWSGVFRFTMASPTTVTVSLPESKDMYNPYAFDGARTVVCDGVTDNENLLPGVSIVLSAGTETGDVFDVGVGCWYSSTDNEWIRILPWGGVPANVDTSHYSIIVQPTGGVNLTEAYVVATNAIRIENDITVTRPFAALRQTGVLNPTADADLNGVAITFDNFVAGSPNTVGLLVDGDAIDVTDVDTDITTSSESGLYCDGTTRYRFADGTAYQSGEFVLSSALAESDTATIFVSDGGDCVELATEGGAWVAGSTGLDLGGRQNAELIPIRIRVSIPSGKDTTLNMRGYSLRCVGTGV